MKQLLFDFFVNDCYNLDNFIVNDSNSEAYDFLNNNENHQIVFLNGEEKSGKTYLTTIWKQKYNAKNININELNSLDFDDYIKKINELIEQFDYYIVDELDNNFNEEKLFYFLNLILNNNSFVLITSKFNIFKKKIHLKDLISRIKSAANLSIKKFPKKTKQIFIVKLLTDKGLSVTDDVVKYLCKKLPNNYKIICNTIDNIAAKKVINVKEIKALVF